MSARISQLPISRASYIDRCVVDSPEDEIPPYGLFLLAFNNKRRAKNGLKQYDAYGTLYPTGHVHVDTVYVQVRDFQSLQQMIEFFRDFGDIAIHWLRGE